MKLSQVLLAAIGLTAFFSCTSSTEAAAISMTGSFVPDKTELILGEPAWLTFRLTNSGTAPVSIQVPPPGLQPAFFTITVTDQAGAILPGRGSAYSGPGESTEILNPDKLHTERLFLPNWCSITKTGRYTVACKRKLSLGNQPAVENVPQTTNIATTFILDVREATGDSMNKVIHQLSADARSVQESTRAEAIKSLSILSDPGVIPALAAVVNGSSDGANLDAIMGLSRFKTIAAALALLPALRGNEFCRNWAGMALDSMQMADQVVPTLLQDAKSTTLSQRIEAIRALGATHSPKAQAAIEEAAKDPAPEMRSAAADALGELGQKSAIPFLKERLRDPDMALQLVFVKSLVALGEPLQTEWLTPIVDSYSLQHEHPALEAMSMMRIYGGHSAGRGIASWLKFDDPTPGHPYNFFLIYNLDPCPDSPHEYYNWINDTARSTDPAALAVNQAILVKIKKWLDEQPGDSHN